MQPERLVLVLIMVGLVTAAVWLVKRHNRARAGQLAASPAAPLWEALEAEPDGRATVVAFSSPSCGACHTAQRPAIEALIRQLGSSALRLIEVDVAERPEVARRFGILTVPSTVVLRADGGISSINQGFAPASRLALQIG